jgi:MFS family permease
MPALALLGMALWVAPSAASAPPLHWLVLTLCFVGLLGGSVNGASGRAVMRWFGVGSRGLAMSIRQSAVPAGGGLGALTMPWLASHVGFSAVYGLLTLACAASGVLAIRWLHEPPHFNHAGETEPGSAGAAGSPGSPFGDSQFWGVVIGIGLLCTPQFALLTFTTVFLHDYGHIGIAGLTATMVTIQVGAIVMRIWSGRYTDRHSNRRVYLRVNTLIATAAFVLLALLVALADPTPPALLIAMVVLTGICVSAWHGVAYTELATLAGRQYAGTALGMTNTGVYIGLFLAPLAIPHLLALGSWVCVWTAAAACALATYPLFPKNHKPVAARSSLPA